MKKQITINIVFSLIYQFVFAVGGIIIPRLLLYSFGSEVNGLVSSLASFLGVFTLFEGGMTAVISSKLYKPLTENDTEGFNKVVASGKLFYRKLAIYYFVFALFICLSYSSLKQTSFSFDYVFILALITAGISYSSNYSFAMASTILYADNKSYIRYIVCSLAVILNIVFTILGTTFFKNIHTVKLLSLLSYLSIPLILKIYVKKHYRINTGTVGETSVIEQRWGGFAHQLSTFVTNNVDIYILTIFSTLTNVSVYSVYSIVLCSIRKIIHTVSHILTPLMGISKAKNIDLTNSFNIQLFINGFFTILIFPCVFCLLDSFIYIYTSGVKDANYINNIFALLFVISELIASLTYPYINVSFAEGDFNKTRYIAFTEVIINVVLSLFLVFILGLVGVIIATVVARVVRFVMQTLYLYKHNKINNIKSALIKTIEKVFCIFVITSILKIVTPVKITSLSNWIFYGAISFLICFALTAVMSLIFDKKYIFSIFTSITKK